MPLNVCLYNQLQIWFKFDSDLEQISLKLFNSRREIAMLKNDQWSYWERKTYLDGIDFLIIGAGIVGYSTALRLRELHPIAKIIILERGILPSGASSKNAGFSCFGSASEIYDDLQTADEKVVWETVEMRWKGLQELRRQIGDDALKLEVNGSWDLFTESERSTFDTVAPYLDQFNQRLYEITGERDVYSIDHAVQGRFGFQGIVASFHNRLEGQIDTGSMNLAFYRKAIAAKIDVLFGCEVKQISEHETHATLETAIGKFSAQKILVCTNGFAQQLINEDVQPARAQVLITQPISGLKVKGTFHYQKGYYYFRNIDGRILFGGGRNLAFEDETTTEMVNSAHIIDALKVLLGSVILPNTPFEIDHTWAGIMGVGASKKPIIKSISPSIYCGVRLGGMGVAIGSLVGQELAELVSQS